MPEFALGNVVENSYCFTALCPIRREADGSSYSFRTQIRSYLEQVPNGEDSPFTQLSSIHLCRLLVIDDLPYEGLPAKQDHLCSAYLLFSANIAGDLTTCLTDFASTLPELIHQVWINCVGYPGVESPHEFITYLKKCQIDTSFFFGGYPQASLIEVLNALQIQKQFIQFVIESQSAPPHELKERFHSFMDDIRKQPTPRPGSI